MPDDLVRLGVHFDDTVVVLIGNEDVAAGVEIVSLGINGEGSGGGEREGARDFHCSSHDDPPGCRDHRRRKRAWNCQGDVKSLSDLGLRPERLTIKGKRGTKEGAERLCSSWECPL